MGMDKNFKTIRPCKSKRVTSKYGLRGINDFHDGCDWGALTPNVAGDKIVAGHNGIVVRAKYDKTYGNYIIIDDVETESSTLYAHLSELKVKVGDNVKRNQLIGLMGTTGHSTGVHLHFEVRNRHYGSGYWDTHTRNGGSEFYSSYDPLDYIVEDYTESKAELQAAVDNMLALTTDMITLAEDMQKIIDNMD